MLVDLILQLLERSALLLVQGRSVHEPVALVSVVKLEVGVGHHVGKASLLTADVLRVHAYGTIVKGLVWLEITERSCTKACH